MGSSTQPNQRQMPFMAEVRPPKKVEDSLIRACDSLLDAIHLCVHLSKRKHYDIAESLGIEKGHWTRIMQGTAHFPPNKMRALQFLCGNWAPLQFQNWEAGFEMYENPAAKRKEELLRELALLDGGSSTGVYAHQQAAMAA